ncbi:hypothetical protein F2Q70_00016405 [Brassica cretica]|uniref:Uncharacterized protein n=1 Tax=Brassica cretica TaxID=69181 RepID=A0A8S9I5X3_BRACR|nr:hypothetical protein F2Q70_00016405 [Brassica cretica]KAF2600440.1 hypothetical protein F2Q68_00009373 [Brassica cretica]KAF3535094.1 hypothetical protein F2Q69_00021012 [Brassica cretica]
MNQDFSVSRSQHNQTDKEKESGSSARFNNHPAQTLGISDYTRYVANLNFHVKRSGRSQLEEGQQVRPPEAKRITITIMKQHKPTTDITL